MRYSVIGVLVLVLALSASGVWAQCSCPCTPTPTPTPEATPTPTPEATPTPTPTPISSPSPNLCPPLHWGYSALVPSATALPMDGAPGPMTWGSQLFPYTVPAGKWLAIKDISLQDKVAIDTSGFERNNYFIVSNVGSAMSRSPLHYTSPVVIPPGATISFTLINNSREDQWMIASMTGYLSSYSDLRECK